MKLTEGGFLHLGLGLSLEGRDRKSGKGRKMERRESGGDTSTGQHPETSHTAARLDSFSIDCLPKLIVPTRRKRAVSQLQCLSGYFNFPPLLTSPQEPLAQSPSSCSQGRDAQKTNVRASFKGLASWESSVLHILEIVTKGLRKTPQSVSWHTDAWISTGPKSTFPTWGLNTDSALSEFLNPILVQTCLAISAQRLTSVLGLADSFAATTGITISGFPQLSFLPLLCSPFHCDAMWAGAVGARRSIRMPGSCQCFCQRQGSCFRLLLWLVTENSHLLHHLLGIQRQARKPMGPATDHSLKV